MRNIPAPWFVWPKLVTVTFRSNEGELGGKNRIIPELKCVSLMWSTIYKWRTSGPLKFI